MGSSLNLPGAFAWKISLHFLSFPLNSLINTKVLALAPESDKSRDPDRETDTAWDMNSWKGTLFFLCSFNGPAQCESPVPLYSPGSGSTRDTVPSRSPKGSRGQDQRAQSTDIGTLGALRREGGWLAWQRAQTDAGTSLFWAAACERRGGEGGAPALSHESSGISWWQGALRKGAVLSQPKHLPFPTSTQERAALCSGPTQWPSERKVTQMQHPPHPQSNQICSLPWLPHLLSVLGPTWVATASRAICSKTGMPGCCCQSTDTSRGITQARVTLLRAPTPLPLPLSLSKGQFFSGLS